MPLGTLYFEASTVWAEKRADWQHVHLPQIRLAPSFPTQQARQLKWLRLERGRIAAGAQTQPGRVALQERDSPQRHEQPTPAECQRGQFANDVRAEASEQETLIAKISTQFPTEERALRQKLGQGVGGDQSGGQGRRHGRHHGHFQ